MGSKGNRKGTLAGKGETAGRSCEKATKTVRNALIMTSPAFPTVASVLMELELHSSAPGLAFREPGEASAPFISMGFLLRNRGAVLGLEKSSANSL